MPLDGNQLATASFDFATSDEHEPDPDEETDPAAVVHGPQGVVCERRQRSADEAEPRGAVGGPSAGLQTQPPPQSWIALAEVVDAVLRLVYAEVQSWGCGPPDVRDAP
jgi:hypothetical protein